jgi:hypothetical protein
MSQVVTRLFDSYASAESAVRELEAQGFPHHDITLGANDELARRRASEKDDEGDVPGHDARVASEVGGEVGGVAGLLAGLGLLAVPGIGPVMAVGWVVSAAVAGTLVGVGVGAAAGGLVGALMHHGVHEHDAHVYAEGVRRGGTLVSVKAPSDRAAAAEAILDRFAGVTAAARGAEYRASGWTRFEPADAP